MILELINYISNNIASHSWSDFLYESSIAIIGGLASGILVYVGVIRFIESRREIRLKKNEEDKKEFEKKYECTKEFLALQMKLILQMNALRGFDDIVKKILDCKISDGTIRGIFSSGFNPKNFEACKDIIIESVKSIPIFTDYYITPESSNLIIDIPFQIYDMNNFKEKEVLSVYFNELSSYNKNYFDILGLIRRRNYIRDQFLMEKSFSDKNQISFNIIYMTIKMAFDIDNKIQSLIKSEHASFKQAQKYISELGLTSPLQIEIDESGMPVFDKKE